MRRVRDQYSTPASHCSDRVQVRFQTQTISNNISEGPVAMAVIWSCLLQPQKCVLLVGFHHKAVSLCEMFECIRQIDPPTNHTMNLLVISPADILLSAAGQEPPGRKSDYSHSSRDVPRNLLHHVDRRERHAPRNCTANDPKRRQDPC